MSIRAYIALRRYVREQGPDFLYDDLAHWVEGRYGDPMPLLVDRILRLRCVHESVEGCYIAYPYVVGWRALRWSLGCVALYGLLLFLLVGRNGGPIECNNGAHFDYVILREKEAP